MTWNSKLQQSRERGVTNHLLQKIQELVLLQIEEERKEKKMSGGQNQGTKTTSPEDPRTRGNRENSRK